MADFDSIDAPADDQAVPSMEEVLIESARLHAMRASYLRGQVGRARPMPRVVRRLVDSAVGHKVRFALLVTRRTGRALREDGLGGTAAAIGRRLRPGRAPAPGVPPAVPPRRRPARRRRPELAVYDEPIGVAAGRRLAPRVLIVAELGVPQCAKYRVWQKKAFFARLGLACTVVDWTRHAEAMSALQVHTLLILYRVGLHEGPAELIEEARRLGVEVLWEVDDLIFDPVLYGENANLRDIPKAWREELLRGAAAYGRAMVAADASIGSTRVLSELMVEASGKRGFVLPNALDEETLLFAQAAVAGRMREDERVVIAYGSGTLTHDTDFLLACPALLRLLAEDERVELLILGSLNLPKAFARYEKRIERRRLTNFKAYLQSLANADIALAPLEKTIFNDAKSNIKLIEASILELPSVCSPRVEFRDAITDGVDGFLAETDAEWYETLRRLVADADLRRQVGARSRARIAASYAPERVVPEALAPIAALMPAEERRARRVLVVNIFFAPQTYGGATVIAEEMTERLAALAGTEVFVFTSHGFGGPQYTLKRYVARGADVIGMALQGHDDILDFDDPEAERQFDEVLAAVRPDVVHLHSIQMFGAGLARACQRAGVAYVVTVHDAWWLCTRQFMVKPDNEYCYQTTIDLKICERCMPHMGHLQTRMNILRQGLLGAARVISPSASHGHLHRINGVGADRLVVNRNGVRMPRRPRPARAPGPLRFGYVGGNHTLKGIDTVRAVFGGLERSDWVLKVVDNTLNLGFSSFQQPWTMKGQVELVPAYKQEGMDAFFEGLDVLLFPSLWKESFGLTVREALVRDVWVIATDSGGAAEDIVPGVNGELIPMARDPEPLEAAVVALLDAPARLAGYVNPLKASIATLEDQAAELSAILDDVLAERRPA